MPDLFHGDPVKLNKPGTFNLMSWLEGHPIERVDPVVDSVIKYMRTHLGCEKIGAVGYCFGVRMRNSLGEMCSRSLSLTKYTIRQNTWSDF
jgi:dienelactone hydrolase